MFNLAIRGSQRAIIWMLVAAVAGTAIYPLIYVQSDFPYGWQLLIGTLINMLVVGWGLFARAQRDLIGTLHEQSERAGRSGAARTSAAGSRARCTTCSRIGSRC